MVEQLIDGFDDVEKKNAHSLYRPRHPANRQNKIDGKKREDQGPQIEPIQIDRTRQTKRQREISKTKDPTEINR